MLTSLRQWRMCMNWYVVSYWIGIMAITCPPCRLSGCCNKKSIRKRLLSTSKKCKSYSNRKPISSPRTFSSCSLPPVSISWWLASVIPLMPSPSIVKILHLISIKSKILSLSLTRSKTLFKSWSKNLHLSMTSSDSK